MPILKVFDPYYQFVLHNMLFLFKWLWLVPNNTLTSFYHLNSEIKCFLCAHIAQTHTKLIRKLNLLRYHSLYLNILTLCLLVFPFDFINSIHNSSTYKAKLDIQIKNKVSIFSMEICIFSKSPTHKSSHFFLEAKKSTYFVIKIFFVCVQIWHTSLYTYVCIYAIYICISM